MTIGSTPTDNSNSWTKVTVENVADRNGPAVRRISVPGGWLYIAEHYHPTKEGPLPVFVPAPKNTALVIQSSSDMQSMEIDGSRVVPRGVYATVGHDFCSQCHSPEVCARQSQCREENIAVAVATGTPCQWPKSSSTFAPCAICGGGPCSGGPRFDPKGTSPYHVATPGKKQPIGNSLGD